MAKEHWATRLKRENQELKAENTQLKTKLSAGISSAVEHPSHLFVAVINSDTNWACDGQTFRLASSNEVLRREPLDDDQVDIVVEDHIDKEEGANFSGGEELQGLWGDVISNFPVFRREHIEGKRIRTIYDPHGFTDSFGLQADQVVRERLKMAEMEPVETPGPAHSGYWHVGFNDLSEVLIDGKSFLDEWLAAGSDFKRAKLIAKAKTVIRVDYLDGVQHEERFMHFAVQGAKTEPTGIKFSVIADKGQVVTLSFADKTPESRWIGNYMEWMPDSTTSDADPEGGRLEFR